MTARPPDETAIEPTGRRGAVGLGFLFGAIYFIQGVGEPVEGLIAQPVRSLLKSWGRGDAAIATFVALLAIPWSLKPIYGLLTDFVPLAGTRRRGYLVAASLAAMIGLAGLYVAPIGPDGQIWLLLGLLVPTTAVAFSDVVADALMVEEGRRRGITGTLQAVQWACLYAATILTGELGGYLSERGLERVGFAICGGLSAVTLVLAVAFVRERGSRSRPDPAGARRTLKAVARSPGIWAVGGFLFLWNFNPFSTAVLYLHMTRALGLGEQFYGRTVSVLALACLISSVAYGFYARRVPFRVLIHASIALGVAATLAYWFLSDRPSAIGVTVAVGLTYMTATLIQLDLAARACPPEVAGTAFATLMALENLANVLSTWLGGHLYQWGTALWGSHRAFDLLVGIGAATTAGCWLLVPRLPRSLAGDPAASPLHGADDLVVDEDLAGRDG